MNREQIIAALAAACGEPWAISRPYFDALRRAHEALTRGELNRELELFAKLPEPEAAIHPATERAVSRRSGSVAVVPVHGVIANRATFFDLLFGGVTTPTSLVQNVAAAMADDQVKAVVMDFDSPGGTVYGVQEAFDALIAMRGSKPLIAQASGSMASAAYWLASAADEIVAQPSAMVGSIGVYQMHEDWSKALDEMGVKVTYVATSAQKVEANPDEPLSEDARAHIQETVDDYMNLFVGAVSKGRGVPASTARGERFGEGRVYVAARAMERGLVDKVRPLSATLAAYGVTTPQPAATTRRSVAALSRELDLMSLDLDADG